MSPRRKKSSIHLIQLYAAVATFALSAAVTAIALPLSDGPYAPFWGPAFAGAATAWGLSTAALPLAFWRAGRDIWLETRGPAPTRPVPGSPGRDLSWNDREWELAERWLAEQPKDVPPVDREAAVRARPEPPAYRPHHGVAADARKAADEAWRVAA